MKTPFIWLTRSRKVASTLWLVLILVFSCAAKVKRVDPSKIPPNQLLARQGTACNDLPFPLNTKTKWLIAENAKNGLSNQLFGIYSYIPVAMLWNVSLVVGEVFTRTSFENEVKKYEGWQTLPFSAFFDWQHFSESWAQRGVAMVEIGTFNNSCTASKIPVSVVTREPHFWPNKDLVINKMLEKSFIPMPVPQNTILQFDPVYPKLTAMYNFWKGGLRNKILLLQVHRSVRPAPHLQRIIDAILATLPNVFYAAHVRLEGDYLLYEHTSFEKEAGLALNAINTHQCLKGHARSPPQSGAQQGSQQGQIVGAPGIYVASGLFNSSLYEHHSSSNNNDNNTIGANTSSGTTIQKERAEKVLHSLRSMGFANIYTRELALQKVIANLTSIAYPTSTTAGTTSTSTSNTNNAAAMAAKQTLHDIATLVPEQGALIDLMVSRACACFISSHYSSSFSYMAQRMRYMDNGQVLRYPDITEANFGKSGYFKQWGI